MRRFYPAFACLLFAGAELPLAAQIGYPGQYPPGQYPGGGYPPGGGGGTGLPFPGRGKKKKTEDSKEPVITKDVEGMLRKLEEKSLLVETADHRMVTIKRSD